MVGLALLKKPSSAGFMLSSINSVVKGESSGLLYGCIANQGLDSPNLTSGLYVYVLTVFYNIPNICCLQPGVSSLKIQLEVGDGKKCKTQDL